MLLDTQLAFGTACVFLVEKHNFVESYYVIQNKILSLITFALKVVKFFHNQIKQQIQLRV